MAPQLVLTLTLTLTRPDTNAYPNPDPNAYPNPDPNPNPNPNSNPDADLTESYLTGAIMNGPKGALTKIDNPNHNPWDHEDRQPEPEPEPEPEP